MKDQGYSKFVCHIFSIQLANNKIYLIWAYFVAEAVANSSLYLIAQFFCENQSGGLSSQSAHTSLINLIVRLTDPLHRQHINPLNFKYKHFIFS